MTDAGTTQREASRFLAVLDGAAVSPPPIWLMRQAGRYLPEYRALRAEAGGFLDLCFDPVRAARVTLQPIERFGFDMAFPAVFIVMLAGMWKGPAAARPWLVSLVIVGATYLFIPGAWYVPAGAISGVVAAWVLAKP